MRKRLGVLIVLLSFLAFPVLLASDKGGGNTELKGSVTALPAGGLIGDWTVASRTVHVSAATRIRTDGGPAAVGAVAEVKGASRSDGSIDAVDVEILSPASASAPPEEAHFLGLVSSRPSSGFVGDWTIGGKTVHVTTATRIEAEGGTPAAGASVEVEGTIRPDGSVDAKSLEVRAAPPGGAPPEAGAPEAEARGIVESLPANAGFAGDWKVAGAVVHVTAATTIRTEMRTLAAGAIVEVKGTRRPDGSLDARRIEVLWGPATSGSAKTSVSFIPSVVHASGRNGAVFTTSVTLANTASVPVEVEIRFHGHDRDGRSPLTQVQRLEPQETRTIPDVLASLFGLASDFGLLAVASNSGALLVESRTETPGAGGRFGQGAPAAKRDDLVREGAERHIPGIRHDADVRTNLVVANTGEIETDVEIELEDARGVSVGSMHMTLRPLEMKQINEVARSLGAPDGFHDGRLRLSTPTANGAVASFASEIDNVTNDPRTLWPR